MSQHPAAVTAHRQATSKQGPDSELQLDSELRLLRVRHGDVDAAAPIGAATAVPSRCREDAILMMDLLL